MPLFAPTSVLLLSTAFTTSYLGSIYLLPSTRISLPPPPPTASDATDLANSIPASDPSAAAPEKRDRNHPAVIKARLLAVSFSSVSSCLALPVVLSRYTGESFSASIPPSLELLGLTLPPTCADMARLVLFPLGLTASLFAGSLYIQYLEGELPGQWRGGRWASLKQRFDGWRGMRTYVVAPLTEELTFRSCIVAVSYLGGWSAKWMVFLGPLWFGLAHVHHAWETYLARGRTKQGLIQGVAQSIFQFLYTTLFGWYATFLFLRTGSLIPPFLAHSFCNAMGLPPLGWALQVWPEKKLSLWASYLAGMATFSYGLWRWTEPALWNGSLYWA
ncbi:hypothetical protein JCM21900_003941 [Sporobolomyces salmonicolor]